MNSRRWLPLALATAAAAALVLRVSGHGRGWLPPAAVLAALLALGHALRLGAGARRSTDWRAFARTHAFSLVLGLLIVVALAVRFPNLGSDLGHAPLDIDEERFANNVRHYFITGELLHETVEHYPGLVFWMFAAASFAGYFKLLASGIVMAPSVIPIETFVISARVANVLVGAATVAVTALMGRLVAGRIVGLGAAAIVAVVPLAVDTTTLVRNDPGMVLAVVAAVYAALDYALHQRRGSLLAAALIAGVATGIKYSSVFALLPVLIASATGARATRVRDSIQVFGLFVAAVAVTNHFVWWDFPNFLRQLNDQIAITGFQHWAATDNPAGFYVAILDRFAVGTPLLLLAGAFFVYALTSWSVRLWVFASFPVIYIWFMTGRPSQFPRWVYPLLPFVAVAGVAVVAWRARVIMAGTSTRARNVRLAAGLVTAALVVAIAWHPLRAGVVSYSRHIAVPTHTQAEIWIAQHAAPGDVVLLEQNWLDLSGTPLNTLRVPNLRATLDGGIEQLPPCQWIIVPEVYFGHPALRRLGLVHRVHAGQGLGGSVGYDYEIYAVPGGRG